MEEIKVELTLSSEENFIKKKNETTLMKLEKTRIAEESPIGFKKRVRRSRPS